MLIKLSDGSYLDPHKVDAIGYAPAKDATLAAKTKDGEIPGKPATDEFWVGHIGHLQFKLCKDDLELILASQALHNDQTDASDPA